MAALSCLLLLGLMPPMEMSSPYAVGSSVPANVMGVEARKEVITYCTIWRENRQVQDAYEGEKGSSREGCVPRILQGHASGRNWGVECNGCTFPPVIAPKHGFLSTYRFRFAQNS